MFHFSIRSRSSSSNILIKILNMFNTADHYITTDGSAIESADLELEWADSSADSNADPPKTGVLVRAFRQTGTKTCVWW